MCTCVFELWFSISLRVKNVSFVDSDKMTKIQGKKKKAWLVLFATG